MITDPHDRSAVIADRRALERNLLRFLLEQEGFAIAREVATGSEAVDAAAECLPDVLLLYEATALEAPHVIERIRRVSPGSTVIVLTADRVATPPSLEEAADAVVEEGSGLQDLVFVLASGEVGRPGGWAPRPASGTEPHAARGRRWPERLQGAVAASILLLGVVLARHADVPTAERPTPTPAPEVAHHLAAAYHALDALADELPGAAPQQVATLTTALIGERAMVLAAGTDVTDLDARIASLLTPLLPSLAPETVRLLTDVLGNLLVNEVPPPPSGSPSPVPTETPSPSAEPSPSEAQPLPAIVQPPGDPSPSPSASGNVSPSPSAGVSPSPSEAVSPTPSESPSPSPSGSPDRTPGPPDGHTTGPPPDHTTGPPPDHTTGPPADHTTGPPKGHTPGPHARVNASRHPRRGIGVIAVVPPGAFLFVASSGAARWLRRRR